MATSATYNDTTLTCRLAYRSLKSDSSSRAPHVSSLARDVVSLPTEDDEEGPRTAVTIRPRAPMAAGPSAAAGEVVIPRAVRRIEREIEANVRRYRAGVRAGVAFVLELVSLGTHATFGPIFTPRLFLRPNVEVAYGELTTLFADARTTVSRRRHPPFNLEGIYRLTSTMPRNRWSPYAGGGVTLGFSHRRLSAEGDDGRSFDFDDLDSMMASRSLPASGGRAGRSST